MIVRWVGGWLDWEDPCGRGKGVAGLGLEVDSRGPGVFSLDGRVAADRAGEGGTLVTFDVVGGLLLLPRGEAAWEGEETDCEGITP